MVGLAGVDSRSRVGVGDRLERRESADEVAKVGGGSAVEVAGIDVTWRDIAAAIAARLDTGGAVGATRADTGGCPDARRVVLLYGHGESLAAEGRRRTSEAVENSSPLLGVAVDVQPKVTLAVDLLLQDLPMIVLTMPMSKKREALTF
jgi:hypothetical protein